MVRTFAWLGVLAAAAILVMGIAHAALSSYSHTETMPAQAALSGHTADAGETGATVLHHTAGITDAGAGDCATCAPHAPGEMLTCMLVTVIAVLLTFLLPRQRITWQSWQPIVRTRKVLGGTWVPTAAPNLDALGISRT